MDVKEYVIRIVPLKAIVATVYGFVFLKKTVVAESIWAKVGQCMREMNVYVVLSLEKASFHIKKMM